MKKLGLLMLICVTALALYACGNSTSSAAPSSAATISASSSADSGAAFSSSSESDAKSEQSSDDIVALDGQGGMEVYLDYNAATGYEWKCSIEPEGVIGIAYQETQDASEDKDITGGLLRDVVTLIANSPGTATLTCELRRPWETDVEPAEVQTFVFTVEPDLQISLDEDASSFVEHPVAISFS